MSWLQVTQIYGESGKTKPVWVNLDRVDAIKPTTGGSLLVWHDGRDPHTSMMILETIDPTS